MRYNLFLITENMLYKYLQNLSFLKFCISLLSGMILFLLIKHKYRWNTKRYISVWWIIYISLILIISIAGRQFETVKNAWASPLHTYYVWLSNEVTWEWYEILLNVLLYIPMGGWIYYMSKSKIHATICSLLFSLGVEICQAIFACGLFEICDLVDNTVGGIIGAVLVSMIIRLL